MYVRVCISLYNVRYVVKIHVLLVYLYLYHIFVCKYCALRLNSVGINVCVSVYVRALFHFYLFIYMYGKANDLFRPSTTWNFSVLTNIRIKIKEKKKETYEKEMQRKETYKWIPRNIASTKTFDITLKLWYWCFS